MCEFGQAEDENRGIGHNHLEGSDARLLLPYRENSIVYILQVPWSN